MGPLGIAALIGGGVNLVKGIFGGIQAAKANRQFKKTLANRPDYQIPEEYKNILSRYQQAYAGNMPGYEQTLSQIGQLGARSRGAAERGAISSNAYGAQVGDIYQKELDALQGLGIQQAQYKQSQLANVAQAESAIAGQKQEQFNINKFLPWQMEMNRWGEQKQAGVQNLFSGIQGMAGAATDFLGTKYYTDTLKGLYPQGLIGGSINPNLTDPMGRSVSEVSKRIMG